MDVNGIVSADLDDTSANPNGTTHVLERLAPLIAGPAGQGLRDGRRAVASSTGRPS